MIVFRRRLVFWLLKAYINKWGKRIGIFFILGLIVFFALLKGSGFIVKKIPTSHHESVGMIGAYTLDTLPPLILSQLSRGLTQIDPSGVPKPDVASSWSVQDSGKTYIFYLKRNLSYSDGTPVNSETVHYSFANVKIEKPNKYTLVFKLKDSYGPFLVTVSQPIFRTGFVGISQNSIKDVKLNGNFVESLAIAQNNNQYQITTYHFYPNQEALKLALVLGEVNKAIGLADISFKNTSFSSFPTLVVEKNVQDRQLVAIFYNNKDSNLSNEKLRNALSYAIPDSFSLGQRNPYPFSTKIWAYPLGQEERKQDLAHAKRLFYDSKAASASGRLKLTLKTFEKYKGVAKTVTKEWQKIGVDTKIEIVDAVPSDFQVFLSDFTVPKDPDQYTLWHKDQENNITRYNNLRIDKLLEDGRKTADVEERKKIYGDFLKYLLSDSPASFLYFPYEYTVTRK